MNWARLISKCLIITFALTLVCAGGSWGSAQKEEEDAGRQYAKSLDTQYKIIDDPAVVDRVKTVGQALAKVANENEVPATYGSSKVFQFKYEFKVVEDKDVNAFSLPGGIIYVNTGLLDFAKTDDELAGVLAHEIAHAAHHHVAQLVRKQSRVDRYVALIALAGILGNMRNQDLSNLLLGAQAMKIGKLSQLTQEAERDADRTAVAYLAKSNYDPLGMLSFMKKLEAQHDDNPTLPMGIFQTHPAPFRRVAAITKEMRKEGLKLDWRKLNGIACAEPVPVSEGSDQYQVIINKKTVYTPAAIGAGPGSKERAEVIAKQINAVLEAGVSVNDLREDSSGTRLVAGKTEILSVSNEDAQLSAGTTRDLLNNARSALAFAIWADWLCNNCRVADADSDESP